MQTVKFFRRAQVPLEFHKVKVVQKVDLVSVERRFDAIKEAKFNTFRLNTKDIFLDMLTDSGTNAMSDCQMSAMFRADEAYAGSASFERLAESIDMVFGLKLILPVHQGRAAENIICKTFVKQGDIVPMNYHFTTSMAHIVENGGEIAELLYDNALEIKSKEPFKGNMNLEKLDSLISKVGVEKIPFIRIEASTNLIGGQPFSLKNLRGVHNIAKKHGVMLVMDASLIGENAYLIKEREAECLNMSIAQILKEMVSLSDMIYFSARKLSSSRGGAICTNREDLFAKMQDLVPLYEGFFTYGGISIKEIESMAVGLMETVDEGVISQSPLFIEKLVSILDENGIPVVMPAGVLGCHVDAKNFCSHIPQNEYPAGALAAAFYLISGVRGMERGTISSTRDKDGNDILADMELLRLAIPRRVFTLSQIEYVADRLIWLFENRDIIGGLRFVEEPRVLRFFKGGLEPVNDWPVKLMERFRLDFGDSL